MNIRFFIVCIALFILAACGNNKNKTASADSSKMVIAKPVPGTPIKYDSSKRYIFLTWDDSPQPPGTNICKSIFHEAGVKATFFSVGMHYNIEPRRKRLLDSIRNSYPEFLLANHSFSHAFKDNYNFFYTHVDSAVNDFLRAEKEMGIQVKIIRLPGRNTWAGKTETKGPKTSEHVAKKLAEMGYNIIGWDVEWEMIKGNSPKQGATQLANKINEKFESGYTNEQNTMVILAHDRMFQKQPYMDSLKAFIAILKKDPRNVFETIDHYPLVQNK